MNFSVRHLLRPLDVQYGSPQQAKMKCIDCIFLSLRKAPQIAVIQEYAGYLAVESTHLHWYVQATVKDVAFLLDYSNCQATLMQ